jgi:hypothetical protein
MVIKAKVWVSTQSTLVLDGTEAIPGLGMFCVHLCHGNCTPCKYEPHHCLGNLNPYDHLQQMYRLSTVHFRRNAFKLHASVTPRVYNAMLSLSSFEPHPDFEQTLGIIRAGGKKAKGIIFQFNIPTNLIFS